jgi:hypothetical protein
MNQLPPTEQQTGKRIVSKGEYVKAQGKQIAFVSFGLCLLGLGALCFICAGLTLLVSYIGFATPVTTVSTALLLTFASIGAFLTGGLVLEKANKIDPGVPLTLANTAHLPAHDSLVRASAQPVQEQEAVLLRAATEAQERHEEQLVRAAGGPEA